jgi:hypothetical protein
MRQEGKALAVALATGLAVAASGRARADRGSIPFSPGVEIFEPTQRALLAWDGKEEIMLLTTDLRASEPVKVLEVVPLPAEPEVKKGDIEVFRRAVSIINSRQARHRSRALALAGAKGERDGPAGEVTFHEKIGAHDIRVTHVREGGGFVAWVERYLRSAGAESPGVPAELREVIEEYIAEGFTWFVFDTVELGTETRTNDAIQYRFRSDCVYYPMRITRTESGSTTVELLVLTQNLLSDFPGIPISRVRLAHRPIRLSEGELKSLGEDVHGLFGRRTGMHLRIWSIAGDLRSFRYDLIAR